MENKTIAEQQNGDEMRMRGYEKNNYFRSFLIALQFSRLLGISCCFASVPPYRHTCFGVDPWRSYHFLEIVFLSSPVM